MSEGDVSLIQDEDVLKKMWQQTEDFTEKKQIRAHMYRLREERLKNLYGNEHQEGEEAAATSEASEHQDKGPRPTPHSDSFADQCFQMLKTKEIRDSESPTREIHHKYDDKNDGQWTVESKDQISEDGHTRTQSTVAHTSGTKEIEGGSASFAALKEDQNTVTQFEDDKSKFSSSEKQTKSQNAEHSQSETKDGAITTSKTSSTSSSTTKSVSQKVENSTDDSVSNKNQDKLQASTTRVESSAVKVSDDQISQLVKDSTLMSREVSHPDANTTIITETRQLPDGSICTSTKKEIRGSSESKSSFQTNQHADLRQSESKIVTQSEKILHDEKLSDLKNVNVTITESHDVCDFSKSVPTDDTFSVTSEQSNISEKRALQMNEVVVQDSTTDIKSEIKSTNLSENTLSKDTDVKRGVSEDIIVPTTASTVESNEGKVEVDETFTKKIVTQLCDSKSGDNEPFGTCIPRKPETIEPSKSTGEYITTYQTDYTDKKISHENSPTHEAWARSLRSSPDNPLRGGSPVRTSNKSLRSSMSSVHSSTSPEKRTYERSPSPKKPNASPERWSPTTGRQVNTKYQKTDQTTKKHSILKDTNYTKDFEDSYSPRNTSPSVSPSRFSPRSSSPNKSPGVSPTRRPTPAIDAMYVKQTSFNTEDSKSPIRQVSPTRYTGVDSPRYRSISPVAETDYMKSNKNEHQITNLDDVEIELTDSSSISEILNTTNENKKIVDSSTLTRKSSLKKSKFDEDKSSSNYTDISEVHNVVKKDSADSAEKKYKEKPPFVRSETYEERCRKILGMPDKKTMVEDAEKNLTEILSVIPTDKSSPERDLPVGLKSAEYVDGTVRKSSLKKTGDQQYLNLVDAEFINVNKDGSVSSTNKKVETSSFLDKERVTEQQNKKHSVTKKDTTVTFNQTRNKSPQKTNIEVRVKSPSKSPYSSTETSPVRKITSSKETSPVRKTETVTKKSEKIINVDTTTTRKSSRTPSPEKRSPTRTLPEKRSPTRSSPEKGSPRRTSPEKRSPTRSSPEKRSPTRTSPEKRSPTRSSPEKRSPTRTSIAKTSVVEEIKKSKTVQTKANDIKSNVSTKTQYRDISPEKKSPARKQPATKDQRQSVSPQKKYSPEKYVSKPRETAERSPSKSVSPDSKRVNVYKVALDKTTTTTTTQKKPGPTRTLLTTTKYDIFKSSDKKSSSTKADTSVEKTQTVVSKEKKPILRQESEKALIKNGSVEFQRRNTDDLKQKDNKVSKIIENKFNRNGTDKSVQSKSTIKSTKMNTDKYLSTRRDSDVVVDEEHAKSSHESSPERIWPTPVKANSDTGKPRYPDKVTEPDDNTFRKKSIIDIISENDDDIADKIIEISDDETETITSSNYKVTGSDECLLSVTEKVTKFLNTDDSTSIKTKKSETTIDSQRKRASDKVEIELGPDECLLSVSDKVSKFANVSDTKLVDKTSVTKDFLRKEINENLKNDECLLSVNDKVSRFLSSAEKVTEPIKLSQPKTKQPDLTIVDETLKSECILSVSDKASKFINTAEKVVSLEKSPGLVSKATKTIDDVKTKFENNIETQSNIQKETVASLARKSSEDKFIKRQSFTEKVQSKSPTERKPIVGPVTIMRSSEAVKKAKAVFENNSTTDNSYSEIKSRKNTKLTDIGVFKKSSTTESVPDVIPKNDLTTSTFDTESETEQDLKSKKSVRKSSSPTKNLYDSKINKKQSVDSSTYSTKVTKQTEHIENLTESKKSVDSSGDILITRRGSGKFGVELRKTPIEQSPIKKTSRSPDSHMLIEDTQDLSLLEEMLEKVTGYEQRRRIRAQIRVLKKNLENLEKSQETYTSKKSSVVTKTNETSQSNGFRSVSPSKKSKENIVKFSQSKENSRSSSPSKSAKSSTSTSPERKYSSTEREARLTTESRKEHVSRIQTKRITSPEPVDRITSPDKYAKYPAPRLSKVSEYTEAYLRKISASSNLKPDALPKVISPKRDKEERLFAEYQTSHTRKTSNTNENVEERSYSPTDKYRAYRTPSPEIIQKNEYETVFKTFKTKTPTRETVNKINNKECQRNEDKPEWASANILKKSNENRTYSVKKIEQKKAAKQTHTTNISKDADPVISSYGIGPRDENGMPLFGIRALRKHTTSPQTCEIKGTVIHKEYTVENGAEPKGHITMTAYSTNEADLEKMITDKDSQELKKKGSVSSVTTSTKFGGSSGNTISQIHKSVPKAIDEGLKVEQRKTVRRGSVKTLTEKYIKNAAESNKFERSSYPKAGLILRSSLRDNASGSASSRSSTPGIARTSSNTSVNSAEGSSITTEQQYHQKSGSSFLDNNTKVTGVQDIITRMKNADIVIDEQEADEDTEARALLNKFLGATVLMAGMEGYMNRPQESRTVTVTKTSTTYSNIDDIWDERILKKLLEESNDYDERRRLRARLRQVMAEQEACAQIVAEAAEAGAGGDCSIEETSTVNKAEKTQDSVDQVHGVLAKLQGAIAAGEDRGRLLELVARLQEDLVVDNNQTRKPSRYSKRRNKKNRHTVGVTKEELDDARKFIENMDFPISKDHQNSLPSAAQTYNTNGIPQSPVKNCTPQPFNLGSNKNNNEFIYPEVTRDSISYYNATPVHQKSNLLKHQTSVDSSPHQNRTTGKQKPVLQESVSLDSGVEVSPKPVSKIPSSNHIEPEEVSEEEEPNKQPINKSVFMNGKISPNITYRQPAPTQKFYNLYKSSTPIQNGISHSMKLASIKSENTNGFIENTNINGSAKPSQNRFVNKKIKMKRANTIDIPKPMHWNQMESDDDSPNAIKPKIPEFTPKTDNDRKFLAFIQKHNDKESGPVWSHNSVSGSRNNNGCNWKSCFGSIKNVFEGTNSENSSRSSSISSAKKFWKASDDSLNIPKPTNNTFASKFTKFQPPVNNINKTKPILNNIFKDQMPLPPPPPPPLNNSVKAHPTTNHITSINKINNKLPPTVPWTSDVKDGVVTASLTVPGIPIITNTVPSGTVIKPIPKPLPVNQFSHAPMSAFKPPPKKASIIGTQPQIWSPPSLNGKDTTLDDKRFSNNPDFITAKPPMQRSPVHSCAPWAWNNTAKENRVTNLAANKFEKPPHTDIQVRPIPPYREKTSNAMKTDTEISQSKRYSLPQALPPVGALSAPNLVRKLENLKTPVDSDTPPIAEYPTKVDTERMQIEFYEKQIKENNKKNLKPTNGLAARRFSEQPPSPEYTYTVTDYTPPHISTFVQLPQIPDIEETKPTPSKKLPDLVLNNASKPLHAQRSPISGSLENLSTINKNNYINEEDIEDFDAEEFKAISKVMKGPSPQQATIKSKNTHETYEKRDTAAKSLKGVLQKFSSPKNDVITQMEKKKAAEGQPIADYSKIKQGQKDFSKPKPSLNSALENNTPNLSFEVYNSKIGNTVIPRLKCNNVSLESKFVDSLKYPPSPDLSQVVVSPKSLFSRLADKSAYNNDFYASNDSGESIINSKLHIPINRMNIGTSPTSSPESYRIPSPYALSKSESWHQLTQQTALKPPSPRVSPGNKAMSRAKSMHLLALPKQFEAGISKDKVYEKKKTVEAYFSGHVSPNPLSKSSSQSAVNETMSTFSQKPCEPLKYSTRTKSKPLSGSVPSSYGLGRSQTMPHISLATLALLDEENVDDAFDDLFNESS